MGKKKKRKVEEPKKQKLPQGSNPLIEKIIADFPESLHAHPRGSFEDQLRKHLLKHKVK
jgi:hypothetical protein|tara:strand:- start:2 stop:178 length:177 start_codon:yes stop_codon:yes gene_type:complete